MLATPCPLQLRPEHHAENNAHDQTQHNGDDTGSQEQAVDVFRALLASGRRGRPSQDWIILCERGIRTFETNFL
jgi:hypothetical protein